MNLDFIKTKKAMVEFAAKHQVKLSSTTLKEMKAEYISSTETLDLLKAETESIVSVLASPIQGDTKTILITNKDKSFSTKMSFQGLGQFCSDNSLRLVDVESVLDKVWLNVGGYSFSTVKE